MLAGRTKNAPLYALFGVFLLINIVLWAQTRDVRPVWGNVPPVVSERGAAAMSLGDKQFSYRMIGLMLQNIGNAGGSSTSLSKYDYNALKGWFFLARTMDPVSNYIPYIAAFYFGSTQNKEQLTPLIDYLVVIGQEPEKNKWRWLAHAVYLARYKQGDFNKAIDLANMLAGLNRDDMPIWARAMPGFVMRARGDKEGAYAMMMGMLADQAETLDPFEIRLLRDNICNQILTPAEAAENELCIKVH